MNKILSVLAMTGLLFACSPDVALASDMPQCATGKGDTNEDVIKTFAEAFPEDILYLFEGEDMAKFLAAMMLIHNVQTPPPADTTEVWVDTGPGGDGSTVAVLFADDCYLGSFNTTTENFVRALVMAELEGLKPARTPKTGNDIIVPLAGARSA